MKHFARLATSLFVVGVLCTRSSAAVADECKQSDYPCRLAALKAQPTPGEVMALFGELANAPLTESERGKLVVELADINATLLGAPPASHGSGSEIPNPPLQPPDQASTAKPSATPGLVVVDHEVDPIWSGSPGELPPVGTTCGSGEKPVVYRPPTRWIGRDGHRLTPLEALHLQFALNLKSAERSAPTTGWDGTWYYGAIPQLEGVAAVWCGAARAKKQEKGGGVVHHEVMAVQAVDTSAVDRAVSEAKDWAAKAKAEADRAEGQANLAEEAAKAAQSSADDARATEARLLAVKPAAAAKTTLVKESACGRGAWKCWLVPIIAGTAAAGLGVGIYALSRTHNDVWVSTGNLP